jgi:ElaB/YqjD/DUF883 family membrane-anchored ribosome-binding protein
LLNKTGSKAVEMAAATVEKILAEIAELSQDEQEQLRQSLNANLSARQNGQATAKKKEPLGQRLEPIPEPDQQGAMRWLNDYWREYPEQWVALDGYRLIAHSTDYQEVRAAAKADGAYLPLITFIESPPERPFVPS